MKYALLVLFLVPLFGFAQDMSFGKRIEKDSLYLDLFNELHAPVEISITAKDSVTAYTVIKERFVIEPLDSVDAIFKVPVTRIGDTAKFDFTKYFEFNGTLGDPRITSYDSEYGYALPFPIGRKYKVIQGFGGNFTHNSERSKYAIDFNTRIGDTICAAREGIVVRTRDEFTEHGGRDLISKANQIVILHEDGTLAFYVHLDYKGVFVAPGERVTKGQAIGISGFTGFTTTPHLHFVVRKAGNVAIPIRFEGFDKMVIKKGQKFKRKK